MTSSKQRTRFTTSHFAEFNSIINRGLFEVVPTAQTTVHRIYGTRFTDEIKYFGTADAFKKSRLVALGFGDK